MQPTRTPWHHAATLALALTAACAESSASSEDAQLYDTTGLPVVRESRTYVHDDRLLLPVLRLRADGSAQGWAPETWDEAGPEDYAARELAGDDLERWIADQVKRMPKKLSREAGGMFPDNPLVVLAASETSYGDVLRVVDLCGQRGLNLWRFAFGVRRSGSTEDTELCVLDLAQERNRRFESPGPVEEPTLRIVRENGGLRLSSGPLRTSDPGVARTWFAESPGVPVKLEPDATLSFGDVLAIIESVGLTDRFRLRPGQRLRGPGQRDR